MMKDDYFKLLRGFDNRQTDKRTDICDCRVAFATEKKKYSPHSNQLIPSTCPAFSLFIALHNFVDM